MAFGQLAGYPTPLLEDTPVSYKNLSRLRPQTLEHYFMWQTMFVTFENIFLVYHIRR